MTNKGFFNSLNLNTGLLKNYDISLLCEYTSERYAINDTRQETSKVKDYFVVDSKVSYEKDYLKIYASVNNIFSEKYHTYAVKSTTSTLKDFYPAPERNFEIGISYKF